MNIRYKTIRRITITGKAIDRKEAYDFCWRNGYRIKRSGPFIYKDRTVDIDRYQIIAEKKVRPKFGSDI